MPWKKQFDVEEALDRAKDTFWDQGYEATSMETLLARMGINRGSFYDTFGSKRDVLIQALRRYDAENRAAVLRSVAEGRSPRDAIRAVFRAMVDGSRGPQGRHGCFLVNSALEVAPKDPEAAKIVRQGFRDIERFFSELLEQGQRSGEFSREMDPAETAKALMNQLIGLMVLVRAGMPKTVLRSVAGQAEKLIE